MDLGANRQVKQVVEYRVRLTQTLLHVPHLHTHHKPSAHPIQTPRKRRQPLTDSICKHVTIQPYGLSPILGAARAGVRTFCRPWMLTRAKTALRTCGGAWREHPSQHLDETAAHLPRACARTEARRRAGHPAHPAPLRRNQACGPAGARYAQDSPVARRAGAAAWRG